MKLERTLSKSLYLTVGLLAAALWFPTLARAGGVVSTNTESALNAALSGGGVVTFACDGTITLTSTKLIQQNTTIDATGHGIVLSGGGAVQIFSVSGSTLSLVNLTVANGKATNGGAIYNIGTLVASYCNFTNNLAQGSAGAAGNNGSNGSTGGDGGAGKAGTNALGGAVFNAGTVFLTNCVFAYNSAKGGAGGHGGNGGNGSFGNGGDGANGGAGGAGYGGALYSSVSSVSAVNCTVAANLAQGGDGGQAGVGGTDTNNHVTHSGDGGKGAEGCGAGFYVAGSATLANCCFYSNLAQGGNSAAALGCNSTLTTGDNGAAGGNGLGGGLCSRGNASTLINCTFYANAATGGNGGDGSSNDQFTGGDGGAGGKGSGGGIYSTNIIHVTNCTLSTNAVYGGTGGAAGYGVGQMGAVGSAGAVQGANIANGSGTFTLKNSIIAYKKNDGNAYAASPSTITDQGNNISSDTSITLGGSGSHANTDPKLLALAYNGGPTATCAITNTTSLAINGGDDSAAPILDQRGYTRLDRSDIGAYEYGAVYDYPTVQVVATNSAAIEGGSVSAFILYRDSTNSVPKTITYTLGGTAVGGVDYVALTNQAVIPAGQQAVTNIVVTPIYRGTNDGPKTVVLTVVQDSSSLYAVGTNNSATVSILDDYPVVDAYVTNLSAMEGYSSSAFVLVRETYYTNGGSDRTIYYRLSGTATNGVDYVSTPTSAVIPAGQATITVPITPIYNPALDGTKTVTLSLLAGTNYSLGVSNATLGLLDDPPTISVTAPWPYSTGTGLWGGMSISRSGGLSHTLTVHYTVSGTALPGSGYTALPSAVTFVPGQTFTNLLVIPTTNPSSAQTVVLTLASDANYFLGAQSQAVVTIRPASSTTNSVASPVGRYWRGSGSDPTYWSMVVPLNYEKGTLFDNVFGNCATLYPGITAWNNALLYHFNATNGLPQTNTASRIAFNNPIVAFGERVGGSALYLNQPYSFGIYAGYPASLPITIQAYARSNYALVGTVSLYLPSAPLPFYAYVSNGYSVSTNAFGLTTTLSDSPTMAWGASMHGFQLTHSANSLATNYYYLVEMCGTPDLTNSMVIDASGATAPSMLYTLEFEQLPPWRSVFIDQPHFDGSPLPPFYAGETVAEMLTNTPPVTNAVALSPASCTNLDNSPELRRHPLLDQFVADMGNDPIALANYVLNNIDLTDPMDYNDNGNISEESINEGGVSRGALGVFLEKQGSPTEQCALLIYLLRQAGVPAALVYPPHNGMKILDARLSRMLKFQVHGGFNEAGNLYTTNTMIAVNYPWVAACIGTNWVHLFPWLKDYEINEGMDLYSMMPTNYSSAYPWVRDYINGTANLLSLAQDGDNTPRVIFPKFLAQSLQQNHPGVSVDDLGVQIVHRRHYYPRWQDFPTPTWVTNSGSIALTSLTDSAITNVSPLLTNVFNTLSVEVYSVNDPTKDIRTGDLRLVDLHNRQFYITQSNSSPTQVQLSLILAPFRTNITTVAAFNDPALLSNEVLSLTLDQFDDPLQVRLKYYRHHALTPAYGIDPVVSFLGYGTLGTQLIVERPLRKGDLAALCLCYGRVTRDMVNVHAQDLWQMQSALRANPAATNSLSTDTYQGALMTVCGMQYYRKVSDFDVLNRNLHKVNPLSSWAMGLSKISPSRDAYGNLAGGTVDPVLPNVDMFFFHNATIGNGTLRPDSGANQAAASQNYGLMWITDLSAEEHQAINDFYQQTNAVSTVRLLQLAANPFSGYYPLLLLTITNYQGLGQFDLPGPFHGQPLQSFDPELWQQITAAFQSSGGTYVTAYITPGPVTNSAYKGMAALILDWGKWQALISPGSLNGGWGENFPSLSMAPANTINWTPGVTGSGDFSINVVNNPSLLALVPSEVPNYNTILTYNQIASGQYAIDPYSSLWSSSVNNLLGLDQQSSLNLNVAQSYLTVEQNGCNGQPSFKDQFLAVVADPVNNLTGEFYVDETDLLLPGPIPLSLRRNYSSQNLADNQFGPGWKLSLMPYLSVSQGATNIYAADMDGAVLAYVQTATNSSVWLPSLAANPQLNNNTTAGAGGLVNRLRDRLVQSVNGSTTNYTLYGADGSVRTFLVTNFNNGIINQSRPYLQQWTDNRGNYYTFTYGTDPSQTDFAQVRRIQCSNGNYLGFYYDIYGHIIEAYSGDGRRLQYDYDQFGDLVTVTLPDASTRSYVYQHSTQVLTNGTRQPYSTHLIVEEDKPDGRALINVYDSQRRVTNQLSTAGVDLNPVRTASFIYVNNFNVTNSYTNTVSGYTLLIDGLNYTNRFEYTNSLITKITDPLGQSIQQSWYPDNAVAPGYPRSISSRTDKRGLVTAFRYDAFGNVTNTIVTGDLTGDGITSQSATNSATYNANCLPLQITDPAGNSTVFVYDPVFTFLPQQVIRYAGATPVSTNYSLYGSVTNVATLGSLTQTNLARGLVVRQIRAFGSSDAATNELAYNGQGFLTQSVRYTGTADPAVTNTFFYNERGEMVDQVDALGAVTHSEFDDMGRPIERDNFDESGNLLAWSFDYYNDNGELVWTEGPRFNPDDYVWRDYDGAGRLSTEIHWRAEAKADGSGVQAPAGYNLYAQSFYQYDVMGNLTLAVDPRGATTTNQWDALGRLLQRWRTDVDGTTVLSHEGFAYEPGGQVRFQTNALGGLTETEYTASGKPEYRRNADGSTNGWRYYLDGRLRREIQNNGAYWETTYDDANRKSTRIFYTASGSALATNLTILDRRGNAVQQVDASFNTFTNRFDGLDRLKVAAGPAVVTVSFSFDMMGYVTNVLQQVSTSSYDAANRITTVSNALGEKVVTTRDALGRQTSVQTFAAGSSTPLRITSYAYSADHHGVTVTQGSGTNAVGSTTWTDNDGRSVLSVTYPSSGTREYTRLQYDLAGNPVLQEHDSFASGSVTTWTTATNAFDGLNRVTVSSDRDNALTHLYHDAAGNITNRVMPGGLQWHALYNSAGQMLQEWNSGTGGAGTRTNSYAYYTSSSAFAGLLQTSTDGRSVACTHYYDDWLRPASNIYSGPLPEHNLTTSWQYDARGLLTSAAEAFASSSVVPSNSVARSFDAYRQLASESVRLGGGGLSSASQNWDAAGRRTQLVLGAATYGFGWRADGMLATVSGPPGTANYTYTDGGLLVSRSVPRTLGAIFVSTDQRDGAGRVLHATTESGLSTIQYDTLSYTGDGLLSGHTIDIIPYTDDETFTYAPLSRRLTQERVLSSPDYFGLGYPPYWTNNLVYDNGAEGGPGLLTGTGAQSTRAATWNGGADAFSRVSSETNNTIRRVATGHVNGRCTIDAWLDFSVPVSVTLAGTNGGQWSAAMDLTPGPHQLFVQANHPSGRFVTNASVWFTNSAAADRKSDSYDAAGLLTQRLWLSSTGQTNRSQTLSWDARGRLWKVSERDSISSGYDWTASYDAFGRRLQTVTVLVTNGVSLSYQPTTLSSAFDPAVEFLELAITCNGHSTWKLYGPDLNGVYGGMQGVGGLESVRTDVDPPVDLIKDARGNITYYSETGTGYLWWNTSRPTGYGAVPGFEPPAFGYGASLGEATSWRGKWKDITGLYWLGARYYNPESGSFLSSDPVWNGRDPNYYGFCGGNPVTYFDSDGRCLRAGNAQLASFEDSFIRGGVGLAQSAFYGAGNFLGMPELIQTGDSLEATKNFMQNAGLYQPGTLNAQIGENASLVVGAYGMASQVPALTSTATGLWGKVASWWDSLWSEPTSAPIPATAPVSPPAGNTGTSFLPYRQGVNYSFDTFNENLGAAPNQGMAPPTPKAGPLPVGEQPYQLLLFPDVPYDRVAQYGYTPTAAQSAAVPAGMEFDHIPPLVQHYYEGPGNGTLPGFNLTQTERVQYGASLDAGGAATPAAQRAQGGAAAQYSRQQKSQWGF